MTTIESQAFRTVLGHYPTGVCVITGRSRDGVACGLVVGSFTSVSLDPPLVAFFPDRRSLSWPQLRSGGRFCVNVLGEDQLDLCRHFAISGGNKFHSVRHRLSRHGMPILDGVVASIDCALEREIDAGDHSIVLGQVLELQVEREAGPLLFFKGSYGRFELGSRQVGVQVMEERA